MFETLESGSTKIHEVKIRWCDMVMGGKPLREKSKDILS